MTYNVFGGTLNSAQPTTCELYRQFLCESCFWPSKRQDGHHKVVVSTFSLLLWNASPNMQSAYTVNVVVQPIVVLGLVSIWMWPYWWKTLRNSSQEIRRYKMLDALIGSISYEHTKHKAEDRSFWWGLKPEHLKKKNYFNCRLLQSTSVIGRQLHWWALGFGMLCRVSEEPWQVVSQVLRTSNEDAGIQPVYWGTVICLRQGHEPCVLWRMSRQSWWNSRRATADWEWWYTAQVNRCIR